MAFPDQSAVNEFAAWDAHKISSCPDAIVSVCNSKFRTMNLAVVIWRVKLGLLHKCEAVSEQRATL